MARNIQTRILARASSLDLLVSKMYEKMPESYHGSARGIHAEVQRLRDATGALVRMHTNANPLDSTAAHEKKVADSAKRLSGSVATANERIQEKLREGLRDIGARIDAKVNMKPNEFAAEIRSVFRSMTNTKQIELLGELVKENRGPELAAIIKAPSVLASISPEIQARFEDAMISTHAPQEFNEQSMLQEIFNDSLVVQDVAKETATAYIDPARLAQIERGEAAALAAADQFKAATAG